MVVTINKKVTIVNKSVIVVNERNIWLTRRLSLKIKSFSMKFPYYFFWHFHMIVLNVGISMLFFCTIFF